MHMGEKDDDGFGLSLSLGGSSSSFANNNNSNHNNNNNNKQKQPLPYFPLNLMQTSQMSMMNLNQRLPFSPSAFQDLNVRGIDMNLPATMGEEEVLVSSPNSTVSSVSGKRSDREENEAAERDSSYEEEDGGDAAARKKLRLSKEQAAMLEETFKEHNTLNPKQKVALAKELNLRPRQVEVWFQNRRARTKLKQTEVDCEYLKRCCENLTEENKRLQKEVTELRTLKLSPQFYMNMSPPTTLTMCPQCERVAVSSTASSSASASSSLPTAGVPNRRQHNNPVAPCQPRQSTPVNPSWAALFPRE